ncbi:MAG: alpha/beta hydrolase domain-containing protein [Acidimicrobiales bacterium]
MAEVNSSQVGASGSTETSAAPAIIGRISEGRHGWPFAASIHDLSSRGIVEEEYFLEGEAPCYRPRTSEQPSHYIQHCGCVHCSLKCPLGHCQTLLRDVRARSL